MHRFIIEALGLAFVFLKVSVLLSRSIWLTRSSTGSMSPYKTHSRARRGYTIFLTNQEHWEAFPAPLALSHSSVVMCKLQFSHSACWWRCWAALGPQTDSRSTEWSCAAESSSARSSSPAEARDGGGLWTFQVWDRYEVKNQEFCLLYISLYSKTIHTHLEEHNFPSLALMQHTFIY